MLLGSETFTFAPDADLAGNFAGSVGTEMVLAMVGTRIPDGAGVSMGLQWGLLEFEAIGSDLRFDWGRWWQVDIFNLPTALLALPLVPTGFELSCSGVHEGIALQMAAFSTNEIAYSFSINGRKCYGGRTVETTTDWLRCAVIDPPFSVDVDAGAAQ